MIAIATPRGPSPAAALIEQVGAVLLATRRVLVAAALILGVPMLFAAIRLSSGAGPDQLDFNPAEGYGWTTALVGLLLALAVWSDEDRFGDSQLRLLPVDRHRHTLIKVAAGWVVLSAFVIALGILAITLILGSGGVIGGDVHLLLVDRIAAETGTGGLETVEWSVRWWQWLMPFTAATVAYLVGSALLLATPKPWLWVGGFCLAVLAFGLLGSEIEWARTAFVALTGNLDHPLGLDSVMTGGWDTISVRVIQPDGEHLYPWEELPTFGRWATATALWMSIAAAGLWLASLRHRERGRGRG